jgi:hypothetical protein
MTPLARQVPRSTSVDYHITLTDSLVVYDTIGRPLKVLGPITVTSLLGREFVEEMTLTLATAPVFGLRQEDEDSTVTYALVLGQALGRRALMDLLYTLAPYKAHGPDRFARVLDNWGIYDRAATNGGSHTLFMQHANSLKTSWRVFGAHRAVFFDIFADPTESTRAVPLLTWERVAHGNRKWQLESQKARLVQALQAAGAIPNSESPPPLDALLGLVTIPYFLPELRRNWPAWKPLVRGGKANYVGPASVPMMALLHRRALLNSILVRSAEEWLDSAETS